MLEHQERLLRILRDARGPGSVIIDFIVGWIGELPPGLCSAKRRSTDNLALDLQMGNALISIEPRLRRDSIPAFILSRANRSRSAQLLWKNDAWEIERDGQSNGPLTQDTFYGVLCELLE